MIADSRVLEGLRGAQSFSNCPDAARTRGASEVDFRDALRVVRHPGLADYVSTWRAMQRFTAQRTRDSADELWLLQHAPVFTNGIAGRAEHLPRLDLGIPLVSSDRGGQVTYHGPGQLVCYALLDLRRRRLSVRELVCRLEQAVIDYLDERGVNAQRRAGAPGVYVGDAKIAAVGLRVSRGCSYHGISLNVDCDLEPFRAIDPCGYPGLEVTRTRDLAIDDSVEQAGARLTALLGSRLESASFSTRNPA
jgi:lipoyl(octanoyl) transferase